MAYRCCRWHEYLRELTYKFKMAPIGYRTQCPGESDRWKNLKSKISCQAPFNSPRNAKFFNKYLHQTIYQMLEKIGALSMLRIFCIKRYYFAHFTELSRVETKKSYSWWPVGRGGWELWDERGGGGRGERQPGRPGGGGGASLSESRTFRNRGQWIFFLQSLTMGHSSRTAGDQTSY